MNARDARGTHMHGHTDAETSGTLTDGGTDGMHTRDKHELTDELHIHTRTGIRTVTLSNGRDTDGRSVGGHTDGRNDGTHPHGRTRYTYAPTNQIHARTGRRTRHTHGQMDGVTRAGG